MSNKIVPHGADTDSGYYYDYTSDGADFYRARMGAGDVRSATPLKKILRAWRYVSPGMVGLEKASDPSDPNDPIHSVVVAASTNDTAAWNSTAGARETADKTSAARVQTLGAAQVIFDAHSDTT